MIEVPPTRLLDGRLGYALLEGVSITVCTIERWTVQDAVDQIDETCRVSRGGVYTPASLSHFLGTTPDAAARKRMIERMRERSLTMAKRGALLTDSPVARASITAWAWLTNIDARAFDPKDRRRAIQWIGEERRINTELVDRGLVECYRLVGVAAPAVAAA